MQERILVGTIPPPTRQLPPGAALKFVCGGIAWRPLQTVFKRIRNLRCTQSFSIIIGFVVQDSGIENGKLHKSSA